MQNRYILERFLIFNGFRAVGSYKAHVTYYTARTVSYHRKLQFVKIEGGFRSIDGLELGIVWTSFIMFSDVA